VHLRDVRVEGGADVEERRPLLVGDLDRIDRSEGCILRLGCDDRDRLALVADLASAFDVSRDVIAAWWCGERSAFTQSMPGTRTSSTKTVRPVTCSIPS
jgi:hypothetical protein